ncbi:TlpA family protein disulfide reductase [Candidatus Marinimicrobia bacterium]|nr:TlpA family protein disulfide reductase [Candidatus Neomarinimicrobiota bacterium]
MKKILPLLFIAFLSCSQSDFQLETVDAAALHQQIATHKGKEAVLVNFWATTCAPCLKEFPMIVELSNKYKDNGIKIYFVTTDWMDYKDRAIAFLEKQGVKGVTFIKEEGNDNNFIRAINDNWSGALPFTIVFDKNGNITDYWEMEKDKTRFESAIKKAIES